VIARRRADVQVRAASPPFLPEGERENSPGWRPRKRTEPWECRPTAEPASRRAARTSSPHITWIVFNAMLLQERHELCLEIAPSMMIFLACDVRYRGACLRRSNGKCAVPLLPCKILAVAGLMHPRRRCALDLPHCRGNRQRRRQRQQNMHMILRPAYRQGLHLVFACNAADVGPKPCPDLRRVRVTPLLR